jgi:hypothetical protein
LNAVNNIEDNFALVDFYLNIFEATIGCIPSPDAKIKFARH